jgi:hypothetical protein
MYTKDDKLFEQTAADPVSRRAAIAALSKRHTLIFWCAMVMSVCALAASWGGKASGLIFSAAVVWSIVFKFESDLRLLSSSSRKSKLV